MPTTKLSHAFVFCLDLEETRRFYCDVIGFEVRFDVQLEGMHWLTVGPPEQPEVELVLALVDEHVFNPEDREPIKQLVAKGNYPGMLFRTTDVDALFEKVRAAGAEIMSEPAEMPYGVRDFGVRDPSGNQLRFGTPL